MTLLAWPPSVVAMRHAANFRHGLVGMLFISVAINYLDRSNLAVVAKDLSRELALDPVHLGVIFSGFGWAYVLCQMPAGWLVDRIAPRWLYAAACGLWSLATFAQGFASGFWTLLAFRVLLGLFESPTFLICSKLVAEGVPENERARAVGFYISGQFVGLALLTPAMALAEHRFGWRSVFLLTGAIGMLWAGLWYRLCPDSRSRDGRAVGPALRFDLEDLRFVLTQRRLWGIYLGQFANSAVPWFFLTWFPIYLVSGRHFQSIPAGFLASIPFLAAFCGVIAGGFVSDLLVNRGASPSVARKAPIIAGMLLSSAVVGADFVSDGKLAVLFLAIGFFGSGFASITWVLVSLVAPEELIGLTGGVFNFFGNLGSVFVPLVIGFIVKFWGFGPALALVSAIGLGGAFSYIFLVGPVERIPAPANRARHSVP